MYRFILFTIPAVLLVSCAGNVKQISCVDNDWNRIGYETATAGKSVRTFDTYSEQCLESPGDEAKKTYVDGFTRGIIEYCTYENGFELGLKDRSLADVCPMELRSAFNEGYKRGKFEYDEKMRRMGSLSEQKERTDRIEDEFSRPRMEDGRAGR